MTKCISYRQFKILFKNQKQVFSLFSELKKKSAIRILHTKFYYVVAPNLSPNSLWTSNISKFCFKCGNYHSKRIHSKVARPLKLTSPPRVLPYWSFLRIERFSSRWYSFFAEMVRVFESYKSNCSCISYKNFTSDWRLETFSNFQFLCLAHTCSVSVIWTT